MIKSVTFTTHSGASKDVKRLLREEAKTFAALKYTLQELKREHYRASIDKNKGLKALLEKRILKLDRQVRTIQAGIGQYHGGGNYPSALASISWPSWRNLFGWTRWFKCVACKGRDYFMKPK